jgi:hypothetical protein
VRNAYNIVVGKRERKRPPGRPRRRWEDDIRMDLREIGWELDASGLGYGSMTGCCLHGNELSGSIKSRNSLTSGMT